MENTGLKEYNGVRDGEILPEQTKRYIRLKLCKGIYQDNKGVIYAGFQFVDKKATRKNKQVTVSGKSPFWFEKL